MSLSLAHKVSNNAGPGLAEAENIAVEIAKQKPTSRWHVRSLFTLAGCSLVVMLCLWSGQEFNARSFSPILPIEPANKEFRPIVYALRAPELLKRIPTDTSEAERLALEVKEIRTGIERLSGARAVEQHEEAYKSLAALSYYFLDQMRTSLDEAVVSKAMQSHQGVAQLLEFHAASAVRFADKSQSKSQAQFFYQASRFSRPQVSASEMSQIIAAMRVLAADKGLAPSLRKRAEFVTAAFDISRGDSKSRQKAAMQLRNLSKGLNPLARVGASLLLAQHARRIFPNEVRPYKKYLAEASQRSVKLSHAEKTFVVRQMISIWRAEEPGALQAYRGGKTGSASSKVPFSLLPFKETLEVAALSERSALADWTLARSNSTRPQGTSSSATKAIDKYEATARRISSEPLWIKYKAALDMRTLDMRRDLYLSQSKASSQVRIKYENALVTKEKEYLDLGVLGPNRQAEAQKVRADIVSYRRELAHAELAKVQKIPSGASTSPGSIQVAENFLNDHQNDPDRKVLKEKLAAAYVHIKNYGNGVEIYRELAQGAAGAEKKRFLTLAIGAQSIRSQWPARVPWDQPISPSEESLQGRELLKSLYVELQKLEPQDWFIAGHIGHLDIQVGLGEKAFADWQALIVKDSRNYHASAAAGWMLTAYERGKNWEKLESLSRVCLKVGLSGTFRGEKISPRTKLALALLEAGKGALFAKSYQQSVNKLQEFSAMRPLPPKHDDGFYHLTLAYWGNKQYRKSVETTLSFVESYPRSQFTRNALLNGGDFATMLTYEENVLALHGRFLKQFPQDPEATRVRQGLYELTMGRELYGEALEMLSDDSRRYLASGDVAQAAQVQAKMMAIEENYGSADRAITRARGLVAMQGASDDVKANAYRLMIRQAGKSGQVRPMRQYMAALESLGDTQDKREAKAEGLLIFANLESKGAIKEFFNLELRDPQLTLQERYRAFSKHKSNYMSVCAIGATSSCAPALHQLARLSENFGASLEDISIQKTLAKDEVDRFQKNKQMILNAITKTTIDADQGSLLHVGMGKNSSEADESHYERDPYLVEGVQWQNQPNWTAQRPQGIGTGFLQWPEKRAEASP